MKRIFNQIFAGLLLLIAIASCKKEDTVNIDLKQYVDNPTSNTPLETWIQTTFLDPYNMAVVYRYSDFYKDDDKVISPANPDKVQPQMQTVLEGFINPYKTVGGSAFIKRMLPKEWVLFGSAAYQTSGTVILATASAGRRVTLYDVNNFDPNNADVITRKLRTIHHEFTHILNQLVPMPTDFQTITKATYNAGWSSVADVTARDNGYVSPYATDQPGEDFAETVSHLLVLGQAWFDARANAATAIGRAALKAKEASVEQYFTINLGVDFRALQREVQNVVRNTYKLQTAGLPYWFGQNLFKTMTINLEDPIYTSNPMSDSFTTAYNNFKAAVLAQSSSAKHHLDYVQFRFESTTALTVRAAYTPAAGGTQLFADYTFSYTINATTGAVTFVKIAQSGTTGNYANAALFTAGFTSSIQVYLTGKTFIVNWMPATIDNANYNKFGGMYVSGTSANYFFGSLGQAL
ncbi:substrate import-associated zinc metallohydrolase lipoprotein [Pedobacter frigoris]|uniref:substrate import-associated zinc metallohydrolase lipoprotein n=1 Tax=Pedobacter frigoris TaxID=2571272 RepID=UPI00292CEBB7|nr:substrate import-associated zinc metallohydrolase lipoprotein [Pedobacter frigoris]